MNEVRENLTIPTAPIELIETDDLYHQTMPAPGFRNFIDATVLNEDHWLYNEEHAHLEYADIGFLWTNAPNNKHGNRIVGECEFINFKGGKWQKARQERQLIDWFGRVPMICITFDANYRNEVSDYVFLATLEHELYHVGHARDSYGFPRFSRETGLPLFSIRGHDVEEFVGIWRRYGVPAGAGQSKELFEAGQSKPLIAEVNVRAMCGTCQSV